MEEIKIGSWVKYSQPVIKDPFSGGYVVRDDVYAVVTGKIDNMVTITWMEGGEDMVPVFKKCIVRTDFVELVCP